MHTWEKREFKTHKINYAREGKFIIIQIIVNSDIYFEMQISSRACEFGDSIKEENNRKMLEMFSMLGVRPNLDYMFKPSPIENERYLIYRFVKSIFQEPYSNLYQFSSDSEYKDFCVRANLQYESQEWFKRIYIEDSLEKALSYVLQQSIIFQDLYFPSESNRITPTLHDVEICNKSYNFKADFMELYNIIKQKNIKALYHFTDSRNIPSIKSSGNILSQKEITRNNLNVVYASSTESRAKDASQGLSDFVRLSFVKSHPMMHTAMTAYGIKPKNLEINPLVILLPDVLISDQNALARGVKIGASATDLANVHFDLFASNYLSLKDTMSKSYYQAEILVPKKIGIEMILNSSELF